MAKGKFERTKPHVNVGTIGHVDHGKTTLTLPELPGGSSSMVEPQPSKLMTRVRFPSPAPSSLIEASCR